MDISFVIVNRNTRELLLACLNSVMVTVPPLSFETFVVDNGSVDGSVQAVKESFPAVRCIENADNRGFARANNQAIRVAAGRYVVLLNSDTVLTPSALASIVAFMDETPSVAVCGGQLLNGDGSLQNSIANFPTLATELLNKSVLRLLFPRRYPGKNRRFGGPTEVESIIGACMVVRKEAIERVGMLDERYFFFFEETDWCRAMKNRGWRVFFHPLAEIYHIQGQTAKKDPVPARIEYWTSRYLYFRKHASPAACLVLVGGLFCKLCGSFLLQLIASPVSGKARARLKVNWALLRWHLFGLPAGRGLARGR